jgi:peroxiredoxin
MKLFKHKLKSILTLFSMVIGMYAFAQEDYAYIIKVGDQAPDFETTTPDGQQVKLAALRGKVVMLQFTASWCSVCRKEMPHIESEIWQKYKDNPNFALYGVDLDEPAGKVKAFAKEIPVSYPLLLDPQGAAFYKYAEKGAGVTRNVIIDKNGKIVFLTRLFKQEEFDAMKAKIEELLE